MMTKSGYDLEYQWRPWLVIHKRFLEWVRWKLILLLAGNRQYAINQNYIGNIAFDMNCRAWFCPRCCPIDSQEHNEAAEMLQFIRKDHRYEKK